MVIPNIVLKEKITPEWGNAVADTINELLLIPPGSLTAAQILTAIKTVDGVGSGLDADLLDGISSAGFDAAGAAAAAQAAAIQRANHSGTQVAATISDFDTAADARVVAGITGKQPLDTELTAIAGLTSAVDKGIQFTGAGTAGTFDLTAAGRALLDDAAASNQRTTLGLGTAATTAATDYATSAQGATADAAVPKALYDANTILIATADNTPAALTIGASTIVGRKASGNILALTPTETRTILNVEDGSTNDQTAAEILAALLTVDGAGSGLDADLLDGISSTGFQPIDTELTAIAGLTSQADKGIQFTGAGTAGTFDLTAAGRALLDDAAASNQRTTLGLGNLATATTLTEYIGVALSDEITAITTGTAKVTIRMPFAMTVTAVRANVNTASSSGIPTINIKEAGASILSTKLTIDANELTSTTAATPAVISDSALADDAEITFDIDVAGTGAKGLKVWIIGTRVV